MYGCANGRVACRSGKQANDWSAHRIIIAHLIIIVIVIV